MAIINHKQNAITAFEEIRTEIYEVEQLLFEATMNLEDTTKVLPNAKSGQEVIDKYKPFVESWVTLMSKIQGIDKLTIKFGSTLDPYLKQLDGK